MKLPTISKHQDFDQGSLPDRGDANNRRMDRISLYVVRSCLSHAFDFVSATMVKTGSPPALDPECWQKVRHLSKSECKASPLFNSAGCDAKLFVKDGEDQLWNSCVGGQTFASYSTEEEALRASLCKAMMDEKRKENTTEAMAEKGETTKPSPTEKSVSEEMDSDMVKTEVPQFAKKPPEPPSAKASADSKVVEIVAQPTTAKVPPTTATETTNKPQQKSPSGTTAPGRPAAPPKMPLVTPGLHRLPQDEAPASVARVSEKERQQQQPPQETTTKKDIGESSGKGVETEHKSGPREGILSRKRPPSESATLVETMLLRPGKRKPVNKYKLRRAVVMSDPVRRVDIQTFVSIAEAEKVTGQPPHLILNGACDTLCVFSPTIFIKMLTLECLYLFTACELKGGMVKGRMFRFATDPPNYADHRVDQPGRSTRTKPVGHSVQQAGFPPTQSIPGQPSRRDSTYVPEPNRDLYFGVQPHRPRFDLSSLQPVRKKTNPGTRPKKIIEVVELATGKVMVCFRGTTDACRALGLERKQVSAACDNFGLESQINFETYTLRFLEPGCLVAAYEFGAHPEDFKKKKNESHAVLLARFTGVYEIEKANGTLGKAPKIPDKSTAGVLLTGVLSPSLGKQGASEHRQRQLQQHEARLLDSAADIAESVDIADLRPRDADMTCLICQANQAQIVFQPCSHCVLCQACSNAHCRRFCPLCRTPIAMRTAPRKLRMVQPRIYSSYAFM